MVRLDDGETGLSARTIARRLSTLSGLFGYLTARGIVSASPVPSGRSSGARQRVAARQAPADPHAADAAPGSGPGRRRRAAGGAAHRRDQAMVGAMLLGGLRRCEVLGLRLGDVQLADKRLFIAEGKGGHERIVPVAGRFFTTLAGYLERERPAGAATDRCSSC